MDDEFPQLDPDPNHKEFLRDWWSPKKLLRADRQQGKTTMMLCEARRFYESGFEVAFLAPRESHINSISANYVDMFGEQPLFDFFTYSSLERIRGSNVDVVVMDEVQETTLKDINDVILPMDPMFIRASACKSSMTNAHYLKKQEDNDFFDSVYDFSR